MSSSSGIKSGITERQDRRYYAHFRELWITYEGYSEEVPLRPPDLSSRGMFIQTPRHFPEGAVLKVRFRLARSRYEVNARAEVRYCLPGVGIGVEFIEIPSEARLAIEDELRTTEIPPPKKS
jgi:hypothetical protein